MKKAINPFADIGYIGPAYFCDREDESQQLISYIKNQTNTTLFAYRRLGKTGLINHVFHKLRREKDIICIYIDILGTIDKASFINQLTTAIYTAIPPNNNIGKKLSMAIQSLRPTLTFDELTGQPSITISTTNQKQQENTISSLFSFLDKQNMRVVFAIDEFQQILSYPENNMEAVLRTEMQRLKNTTFIFCGSNQNMMLEIFESTKRPFFASCTYFHLDYIRKDKYKAFITRTFNRYQRKIDTDAVDFICEWTLLHTFYTQYFCNILFAKNQLNMDLNFVRETAAEILKLQESKFYQYRNLLTSAQWKMLIAVGKEQRLFKPHSKKFILKYQFGTSSIVSRGIDGLLKKEMILHNSSVKKSYYEVYDKFLMRWLQGI